MTETGKDSDFSLLDGGVVGRHPRLTDLPIVAAPATAGEFNTIRVGLVPVACFRVDNVRFAFDSSFVGPGAQSEVSRLGALLQKHPPASLAAKATPARAGSPLSVFGHADSTGDDEYNKILSGRRAQAVYALLIRDVNLWDDLYTRPHGHDKWGVKSIDTMLLFLGRTGESAKAIDGNAGQRKALFAEYMQKLCGNALPKLEKQDFLAQGKDSKGKGDFQGCGEFNPSLVLSQKQHDAFAKDEDKTARNEATAPNRRVMVLIFREGSKVEPAGWPCPRAGDGTAACRKRFWSDGEKRRTTRLAEENREFPATKDTFGCRFYHRLSEQSPCEQVLAGLRVRLYAGFGRSIPLAPFSVTISGREPTPIERADGDGVIALSNLKAPSSCIVNWGFPPKSGEPPELLFSRTIFLVLESDQSEDAAMKRLSNLGYVDDDPTANIVGFQLDYGHLTTPALDPTGELDERTLKLVEQVYSQAADDLRDTRVT
jgi:outer membrane protein OmpA-like peptidoglycan-associated protein